MHSSSSFTVLIATALLLLAPAIHAQQCSGNPSPTNSIQTSLAAGYAAQVVATGLTAPRSIEFDSNGNLLVLEQARGLSSHVLKDNGGVCVTFQSSKDLVLNSNLTHGLALSANEQTLYVSDSNSVYSYSYNATTSTIGTERTTFVTGMENADHTTRTILYPRTVSGILVVSRGSGGNLDLTASTESNGISEVKAFNLTGSPTAGYNFATDGQVLGWGLRNDVGIVEHPSTSGLWAVENSFDSLVRNSIDVHENNPGEELNFLGYFNPSTSTTAASASNQGTNFGYPYCFTAWDPAALPDNGNISVGTPFAQSSVNDSMCAATTPPRLTFQAHTAPLDIKFNASASSNNSLSAWITFHGSWDRTMPVGYYVGTVAFDAETGEPVEPATSNTSFVPVLSNTNNSRCPGNCFRPVGMAFDKQGRMFMASDASGEIYVIMQDKSATGTGNATTSSSTTTGASSSTAATLSATAKSGAIRPAVAWTAIAAALVCTLSLGLSL